MLGRDFSLVAVALSAQAADLIIRRRAMALWSADMWLVFVVSVFTSLLLAAALVPAMRGVRSRAPRLAAVLVGSGSVLWCWSVVLSLGYFVQMGSLPVPSAVRYFIEEPQSTLALIGPYLRNPLVVISMLAAPVLIALLWWRAAGAETAAPAGLTPRTLQLTPHMSPQTTPRPPPRITPLKLGFFGLLARVVPPILGLTLLIGLSLKPPRYRFTTADVHASLLMSNMVRLAAKGQAQRLSKPHRQVLPALTPALMPSPSPVGPPNVLLIVNETFGSSALSLYGNKAPTTPQTDAFITAHPDTTTVFTAAQANAGSTLVSLPSIFSGLAPTRTAIELHAAPLIWHMAKAAGYTTFLHTAQNYNWLQLDLFLLDAGLDHVFHAGKTTWPVVNDIGVADEKMIAGVLAHLDKITAQNNPKRPFFGVVQFNATHAPNHWHPGHDHHFERLDPRQERSHLDTIAFVDALTGNLLRHLKQRGLLHNTVVLVTADHGHNRVPARLPNRLHNYFESVARIPFWLSLPPQLARRAAKNLAQNRQRRISNLDIVPTLIDAMGLREVLPKSVRNHLDGHSLLRPLPAVRLLPFVNNTEIRQADRVGFSLVRGELKYLFYELETGCQERLYRWRTDPDEQHDLWPSRSAEDRKLWYGRIRRYPLLERARMQGPCPPPAEATAP